MLRLLMDENVPGAIAAGIRQRYPGIDLVRVQEVGLMQTPDPAILEWAAQQGRIVVSLDKRTLGPDAFDRVRQGLTMPGVLLLRQNLTIGEAIDELGLYGLAGNPDDLKDQVVHIPL